jgi:hypothetical protein
MLVRGITMALRFSTLARSVAALCAVLVIAACSNEIDREFGPSALQGEGMLPGRAITTSPPTGF